MEAIHIFLVENFDLGIKGADSHPNCVTVRQTAHVHQTSLVEEANETT